MTDAPEFRNLVDLCTESVERYAASPRFGTRKDGTWHWITFAEFGKQVDDFRAGLASLGVGEGDAVAVISNNRVEWAVGAYATYSLGALYVPMYEKQLLDDWRFIIQDSGAKVLLVANGKIEGLTRGLLDELESIEAIVDFEGSPDAPHSYAALLAHGAKNPVAAADPDPAALAGLIYTSGTTGRPKGVRLTHGNFVGNVNGVRQRFPMSPGEVSLSFLPWAHSFGQTAELHVLFSYGGATALNSAVENLLPELSEVKPTVFFSVPRVFNKIYDGLNKKMAAGSPLSRKLFEAAMANSDKRRELAEQGRRSGLVEAKHAFFDKLVFSKVRDRLGGRLKYAFSGGAAISKEVATFIDNVGITVYEGYGLSETSPIATINYPDNRRIGSVGKPIPGVEILIDTSVLDGVSEEGEVLVKGHNVMQGYHGLDDETAKVMRQDGAFRTGDLGRVDADGFLYITGRIKEQYKLENGKYVVPAPLEEQLQLSGLLSQAMVYGANKLFNVAVLVPDFPALEGWAKEQGIDTSDRSALCRDPRVRARITEEIAHQQQAVFKGFERIKNFRLIPDEFSVDNDMLTPKMSMKRRNVIKAYQGLLDAMYEEGPNL